MADVGENIRIVEPFEKPDYFVIRLAPHFPSPAKFQHGIGKRRVIRFPSPNLLLCYL